MINLEMIVQVKKIENTIINEEIETKKYNGTILSFDISSYVSKDAFNRELLRKDKNLLLACGDVSDFVSMYINEDDYLLVNGNLKEVSSDTNLLIPKSIEKVGAKKRGAKKIAIKSTNSLTNFKF